MAEIRKWDSVEECLRALDDLSVGDRKVAMVVLHHTWQPSHAQWRGDSSAAAVRKYWLARQREEGWRNPPGGHFIVAPKGEVYAPFGDLVLPLNANSSLHANRVGVAIEAVGNFDLGNDVLEDPQRHAVVGLIGGLLLHFKLDPGALMFHRSFPEAHKTCPGTSLSLSEMRAAARFATDWAQGIEE